MNINPFRLISVASSKLKKMGRAKGDSVLVTAQGDDDRDYDSEFWATHGIVSRPAKTTRALRLKLGPLSIVIAAYTYGIDPPSNPGACKLYGTDSDGAEKISATLDSDGKLSLSNSAEDFAKCIDDLITEIKNLTTFGSAPSHSVTPTSIANLSTIATRFKTIIKEA